MKYRYLISVAIEMDGHAGSEVYYLESERKMLAKDIVPAIYGREMVAGDINIDMERDNQVYGRLYDDYAFALTCTHIPHVESDTLYESSSRTG
jgi:hypothetical protein